MTALLSRLLRKSPSLSCHLRKLLLCSMTSGCVCVAADWGVLRSKQTLPHPLLLPPLCFLSPALSPSVSPCLSTCTSYRDCLSVGLTQLCLALRTCEKANLAKMIPLRRDTEAHCLPDPKGVNFTKSGISTLTLLKRISTPRRSKKMWSA